MANFLEQQVGCCDGEAEVLNRFLLGVPFDVGVLLAEPTL
jgi:hypothetical protein